MTEEKKLTPGEAWGSLWNDIALYIPTRISSLLATKQEEEEKIERNFLTIIVPLVIVVLSVASITNMIDRAEAHHVGLAAKATGTAIAVLVPIAVFAAIKSKLDLATKAAMWIIAFLFAAFSSAVQFKVYAPVTGWEFNFDLIEAIAFGAGVPASECLLAVIEYFLLEQDKQANEEHKKAKALKLAQAIEEKRKEEAEARAETRRLAEAERNAQEEAEQRRQEFEFEMRKRELELNAKLEADRIKLESKLNRDPIQKPDSKVIHESNSSYSRERKVIDYYRENRYAKQREASEALGISQPTLNRILNQMKEKKMIKNGDGIEVIDV